jgi:hypothetical protein
VDFDRNIPFWIDELNRHLMTNGLRHPWKRSEKALNELLLILFTHLPLGGPTEKIEIGRENVKKSGWVKSKLSKLA